MTDDTNDQMVVIAQKLADGSIPGLGMALIRLRAAGYGADDPDLLGKAEAIVAVMNDSAQRQAFESATIHRAVVMARPSFVYYMQIRDTIKIGYTAQNVEDRRKQLMADRVLAVEPGDRELEVARHRQFCKFRLRHLGQERYRSVPQLTAHIEWVLETHPTLNRLHVIRRRVASC